MRVRNIPFEEDKGNVLAKRINLEVGEGTTLAKAIEIAFSEHDRLSDRRTPLEMYTRLVYDYLNIKNGVSMFEDLQYFFGTMRFKVQAVGRCTRLATFVNEGKSTKDIKKMTRWLSFPEDKNMRLGEILPLKDKDDESKAWLTLILELNEMFDIKDNDAIPDDKNAIPGEKDAIPDDVFKE